MGQVLANRSEVKSGVTQGLVLGPQQFDIFIDDLDDCAAELEIIVKFADATQGFKEIGGPEDKEKLQNTLDKLEKWAEKWGMAFNIPKCKIMHVGPHNPGYTYMMSGQPLIVSGGRERHGGDSPQKPETSQAL